VTVPLAAPRERLPCAAGERIASDLSELVESGLAYGGREHLR
jgi:hypothetical protein